MPQVNQLLVVKRLQRSELGFFEAHRKNGLARSRQRGLNLDKNVIDLILTPQQREEGGAELHVTYRTPSGQVIRESQTRPIKHQAKNWRLTGNKLPEPEFQLLNPGDFILLLLQVSEEIRLCWEAMRLGETDPSREAIVAYLSEVTGAKTTALTGATKDVILAQWKALSPSLFAVWTDTTISARYTQARLL